MKKEVNRTLFSYNNMRGYYESISNHEMFAILELQYIDSALQKSIGQKAVAASMLGMKADQLMYKILKMEKFHPNCFSGFKNIIKAYKLKL